MRKLNKRLKCPGLSWINKLCEQIYYLKVIIQKQMRRMKWQWIHVVSECLMKLQRPQSVTGVMFIKYG